MGDRSSTGDSGCRWYAWILALTVCAETGGVWGVVGDAASAVGAISWEAAWKLAFAAAYARLSGP